MSQRYTAYTNVTAAGFALDPSGGWSVCGWLYLVADTGGDGDLFFVQPTATPGSAYAIRLGYSHNGSDPTLRFRSGDGTDQLNHTEVVTTGQWYNLAITYDGTTARAYVDGVEVASQTMAMSGTYDQCDLGDFAFGTTIVELAQIKVWEGHALSPAELATEILYWQPQTATGDVYAWWQQEAADPTLDSSGNGHTLSGPGTTDGSFTPPGQLNPSIPNVAAVGGSVSDGVAVVRQRLRVQAVGNSQSGSLAWVSTNVAPEGGGSSSFGGRARKRRGRR
jgi:hypothetical protein